MHPLEIGNGVGDVRSPWNVRLDTGRRAKLKLDLPVTRVPRSHVDGVRDGATTGAGVVCSAACCSPVVWSSDAARMTGASVHVTGVGDATA